MTSLLAIHCFYSSLTYVSFSAIWPTQKCSFYDRLKFDYRVSSKYKIVVCYRYLDKVKETILAAHTALFNKRRNREVRLAS